MSAPTNISAATATNLGSIAPQTITQTVADSGTTYTVWFKYTASSYDDAIGVLAYGDVSVYQAALTVYESDGITVLLNLSNVINRPVQFPVTATSTYYLSIASHNGNVTPAVLTLNLYRSPRTLAPIGSLVINDDAPGFPAALLSSSTGTFLRFESTVQGELGDVVPSGVFCLTNEDAGTSPIKAFVYHSDFTLIGSPLTFSNGPLALRGNGNDKFYMNDSTAVKTVTTAGAVGGTTWTLPLFPVTLAPSRDDTILYWSHGGAAEAMKRWDLVNNVALSNLVAAPTGYVAALDTLVLANGHVLVTWLIRSPRSAVIREYQADGTFVREYTFSFPGTSPSDGPRLAINAADDSASFWLWCSGTSSGTSGLNFTSRFIQFKVSDGSTLTTFDVTTFEAGIGPSVTSAWPEFGNSKSCPFFVSRAAIPAGAVPDTTTTTTYPVRRLRQTAHLSDEQVWLFFSKFQLDCETGVGLNSGQGSDPQVMLSWSDDGGHTWSEEQWMSAGKQGEYKRRVIWRRLGRSRDRVWRIVVSDPVAWRLLTAYIDVTKGTS